MEAKTTQIRPLKVEEITNLRTLRRLAREGRLYLDITPAETTAYAAVIEQALQYVGQIDSHAQPQAMPAITTLWRTILTHPQLNDKLTIEKGPNEGQLNRYRMMYLVTCLLEAGIYVGISALQLHHILEHTRKKDAIYRGQMKYAMERTQLRVLREIISDFRKKYMD